MNMGLLGYLAAFAVLYASAAWLGFRTVLHQ